MRTPVLLAAALALSAAWGAAQTKLDVKDIENHPFTADSILAGSSACICAQGTSALTAATVTR